MRAFRLGTEGAPILLPRRGPLVLGAVSDGDADVVLAAPTVSGRHLRLEVVPCAASGGNRHDYRHTHSSCMHSCSQRVGVSASWLMLNSGTSLVHNMFIAGHSEWFSRVMAAG